MGRELEKEEANKIVAALGHQKKKSSWQPFFFGGAASLVAETCTIPIDTCKIRLQIQGQLSEQAPKYRGMFHAFYRICQEEGVRALYRGLSPALLRQASYGTIKMGVYQWIKKQTAEGGETLGKNMFAGAIAGALSAVIATPTDVVKIRMQANSATIRYTSIWNAFTTIFRQEGLAGLWKGAIPTSQRAVIIGCVELPTYDQVKRLILKHQLMEDNIITHFTASFAAGFTAAIASNPIDVVKTRLMNQRVLIGETFKDPSIYKGTIDCLVKTVRNEGFFALYKGFVPNYVRLAPWAIIFFVSYEQLMLLGPD